MACSKSPCYRRPNDSTFPSGDEMFSSVGTGGVNDFMDVIAFQLLLNEWRQLDSLAALDVDGLVGQATIGAIEQFQLSRLGFKDGRIDPDGPTMLKMLDAPGDDVELALRPVVRDLVALADSFQILNFIPPALIDQAYNDL